MSKERGVDSELEMLDILLKELIVIRERNAIDTAYSDYYDSLTEDEISEQRAWGAFSESQTANTNQ